MASIVIEVFHESGYDYTEVEIEIEDFELEVGDAWEEIQSQDCIVLPSEERKSFTLIPLHAIQRIEFELKETSND